MKQFYEELVEAGLDDEARRNPDAIEAVFRKLNAADEAEAARRNETTARSRRLTLPVASARMLGTIIGLVLLVALLGVMFYCARMLLPLISPILRVLIILLVAIAALYVIVVLLGVIGIHVPVHGF
jgi:hypothetical protein